MARLEYMGKTFTEKGEISQMMTSCGLTYESWGLRSLAAKAADHEILGIYKPEVDRLMRENHYISVDLVALSSSTPQLSGIIAKFDKEHHHVDDEVRFTVEGEGVFEIEAEQGQFVKFKAEPGDLIVIPAFRRHLFYLTDKMHIRCIRLFKTKEGWEAIYPRPVS